MKNTITVIMQRETVDALAKVPAGCVNARSARLGVYEGEPLLVIADALLSYAKAYLLTLTLTLTLPITRKSSNTARHCYRCSTTVRQ